RVTLMASQPGSCVSSSQTSVVLPVFEDKPLTATMIGLLSLILDNLERPVRAVNVYTTNDAEQCIAPLGAELLTLRSYGAFTNVDASNILIKVSSPRASCSSNRSKLGLSRSSTPRSCESLIRGTTISEFDALS